MIDGEGGVALQKTSSGYTRCVHISNMDRELIQACGEACQALGINCRIYAFRLNGAHNRPNSVVWRLYISRQADLILVEKQVPIQSLNKRARLRGALNSYRMAPRVRALEPLLRLASPDVESSQG